MTKQINNKTNHLAGDYIIKVEFSWRHIAPLLIAFFFILCGVYINDVFSKIPLIDGIYEYIDKENTAYGVFNSLTVYTVLMICSLFCIMSNYYYIRDCCAFNINFYTSIAVVLIISIISTYVLLHEYTNSYKIWEYIANEEVYEESINSYYMHANDLKILGLIYVSKFNFIITFYIVGLFIVMVCMYSTILNISMCTPSLFNKSIEDHSRIMYIKDRILSTSIMYTIFLSIFVILFKKTVNLIQFDYDAFTHANPVDGFNPNNLQDHIYLKNIYMNKISAYTSAIAIFETVIFMTPVAFFVFYQLYKLRRSSIIVLTKTQSYVEAKKEMRRNNIDIFDYKWYQVALIFVTPFIVSIVAEFVYEKL